MRRALPFLIGGITVWTACGNSADELFGGASAAATTGATSGAGGAGGDPSGSVEVSVGTTTTGDPVGSVASTGTGEGGAGPASSSSAISSGSGGPDPIGCSDGTREYFVDPVTQPEIAGCDAGFDVPGVTTPESMSPACGRISGNDSANPDGAGCSAEDACSEGWHVCHGSADVAASSATGQCEPSLGVTPVFYITRQAQDEMGLCAAPPATNNIAGCGSLGAVPSDPGCLPLDRRMRVQECIPTGNWYCGNGANEGLIEAQVVMKFGSGEGGVLCCRD